MNNDSLFNIIMHKSTIITILILSFAISLNGQGLSLKQAISTAMENNSKIRQYEEKSKQKYYEKLKSRGNFLPKITLTVSYARINDPLKIDLAPVR
ncbi:MAG: TolC family protein, partial [Ignavibacteriales bacterium]|nr:TolC family protein [Ignavibacteriales bacterium]MCF8438593.1 TolC family protein [Ignavibacteriales bacterium]